ncbi:MAG: purple acid phosphatase family protein [Planctomycetota bacterium]
MRSTHGERAVGVFLLVAAIGLPIWHALYDGAYGNPVMALPPGIARPPHIALVTQDGATIAWTTSVAMRGGVEYAAVGEPWTRVTPDRVVRNHEVRLEALRPATRYQYRLIVHGRPRGGTHSFLTAPGPDATIRVVLVGDTGSGSPRQRAVIDRIRQLQPDLIVHTGDLAYPSGTPAEVFGRFVVPFAELRDHVPMLATLGNHDVKTDGGRPILDAMVLPENRATGDETFYRWQHGPLEVICVDTESSLAPGSPQREWLERTLDGRPTAWRLVFGHRAIYAGSRSRGDPALRDHLAPLLERARVPLYASGHDHVYMRTFPLRNGTPVDQDQEPRYRVPTAPVYVVTGGGGKSLYEIEDVPHNAASARRDHVVLLVVSPTHIDAKAIAVDGEELDHFTLEREPS